MNKNHLKLEVDKLTKNANLLNQIIHMQSLLTEAEFDLNAFMQLVAEQMHKLTPATGAVVELVDKEDMVYRAASGTVAEYLGLRLNIANSISGMCIQSQEVLRSNDTEIDPRVNIEACRKVSARSLIVAPLIYRKKPVGVLKILSNTPNAFDDNDVQTLQLMAGFIASGLAHQMSFEMNNQLLQEKLKTLNELEMDQARLHHLAHYDFLTNLANRSTFYDKLRSSMSDIKNKNIILIGIMYLDIDHFKNINDTLGHDMGDELLKIFAKRLKYCTRESDVVARFGGDEFVILLTKLNHSNDAVVIAKKIISKMNEPFKFKNETLKITTSIGVSFYHGENFTADELVKQADSALYQAKRTGRNNVKLYSEII